MPKKTEKIVDPLDAGFDEVVGSLIRAAPLNPVESNGLGDENEDQGRTPEAFKMLEVPVTESEISFLQDEAKSHDGDFDDFLRSRLLQGRHTGSEVKKNEP